MAVRKNIQQIPECKNAQLFFQEIGPLRSNAF
jgi:hypothetical protein